VLINSCVDCQSSCKLIEMYLYCNTNLVIWYTYPEPHPNNTMYHCYTSISLLSGVGRGTFSPNLRIFHYDRWSYLSISAWRRLFDKIFILVNEKQGKSCRCFIHKYAFIKMFYTGELKAISLHHINEKSIYIYIFMSLN
jgi:hypothetical protein